MLRGKRTHVNHSRVAGRLVVIGALASTTQGQQLGLRKLADKYLDLGAVAGAVNPGAKARTTIASLLAAGDCIDPVNVLRAGRSAAVLGHDAAAASTVATFLRLHPASCMPGRHGRPRAAGACVASRCGPGAIHPSLRHT
jgi:hypothetical protein